MNDEMLHLVMAGYGDHLDGKAVLSAGLVFLGLLKDIDIALSADTRGTIQWEISSLKKASPADIGFVGRSKLTDRNLASDVGRVCIAGLGLLAERPEREPHYSDLALQKARRLAKFRRTRKFVDLRVRFSDSDVSIEPVIATHVEEIIKPVDEADGSVVGNLDSISVHTGNEFRVWDEVTGKAVTCQFHRSLLETAKEFLKRRVLVYGIVHANQLGNIASMLVEGIEPYPTDEELPTISDMSGAVDLLGDLSLKEYMQTLRED